MPILPAGLMRETEIAEAVADVERALAPDVVRIRYDIGTDWSGEWAVYFRALLSDQVSKNRLRQVAKKVVASLDDRLNFQELGLNRYHYVRSESEQAAIREKSWA